MPGGGQAVDQQGGPRPAGQAGDGLPVQAGEGDPLPAVVADQGVQVRVQGQGDVVVVPVGEQADDLPRRALGLGQDQVDIPVPQGRLRPGKVGPGQGGPGLVPEQGVAHQVLPQRQGAAPAGHLARPLGLRLPAGQPGPAVTHPHHAQQHPGNEQRQRPQVPGGAWGPCLSHGFPSLCLCSNCIVQ